MKIGDRIKSRRVELGMTVDDLAEKLGKNRATVYRYESGDIENLPTTVLESIAKALETSPSVLMGWLETCSGCGFTYDPLSKEECLEHNRRHLKWEQASKKFGRIYAEEIENERIKGENRLIRNDSKNPFDVRYEAELKVLRCLYSRSISVNDFRLDYPTFEEYVAMMMNSPKYRKQIGEDIATKLIDNFGVKPGIGDGESYYYMRTVPKSYDSSNRTPIVISDRERSHILVYRDLSDAGKDRVDNYTNKVKLLEKEDSDSEIIEKFRERFVARNGNKNLSPDQMRAIMDIIDNDN